MSGQLDSARAAEQSAALARARAILKKTGRDMSQALAEIGRLADITYTVYLGPYDVVTDEVAESVNELLRAVREDHPGQELEIAIFAAPVEGEARGGGNNGNTERDR